MRKKLTQEPDAEPPVSTDEDQRPAHLFKPGQSGNPNGRPKGSRNKLGEAFVEAMYDDFTEHGVGVIAKVREEDPVAYVKVVASILPKELKIETASTLNDEQLDARIRQLADALEIGVAGPADRAAAAKEPKPPGRVPTLQ